MDDFRSDPLFPRIARAVAELLASGKIVAPIDVLVGMNILTRAHIEDWRFAGVLHLERVIKGNLTQRVRPRHLGRVRLGGRRQAPEGLAAEWPTLNGTPSLPTSRRGLRRPFQDLAGCLNGSSGTCRGA